MQAVSGKTVTATGAFRLTPHECERAFRLAQRRRLQSLSDLIRSIVIEALDNAEQADKDSRFPSGPGTQTTADQEVNNEEQST